MLSTNESNKVKVKYTSTSSDSASHFSSPQSSRRASESRLRRQDTRANDTSSEPARRLVPSLPYFQDGGSVEK